MSANENDLETEGDLKIDGSFEDDDELKIDQMKTTLKIKTLPGLIRKNLLLWKEDKPGLSRAKLELS